MFTFPKFIHWSARLVALVVAAFFLFIFIGELASPHGRAPMGFVEWGQIALLVLVIVGMLLAWKWALPGALLSLLALIAWGLTVQSYRYPDVLVILAAPSVLFLGDRALHLGMQRTS